MLLRPVCPGGKKIHEGCHRSKPRNQGHSTRVSHPASSEAPARQDRTRLTSLEGCGHPVVVGIGHADVAFTMKQYVKTGLEADRGSPARSRSYVWLTSATSGLPAHGSRRISRVSGRLGLPLARQILMTSRSGMAS